MESGAAVVLRKLKKIKIEWANQEFSNTEYANPVPILTNDYVFYMYFETPPSTFSPNSKNDDFAVLYAYEMKIWW